MDSDPDWYDAVAGWWDIGHPAPGSAPDPMVLRHRSAHDWTPCASVPGVSARRTATTARRPHQIGHAGRGRTSPAPRRSTVHRRRRRRHPAPKGRRAARPARHLGYPAALPNAPARPSLRRHDPRHRPPAHSTAALRPPYPTPTRTSAPPTRRCRRPHRPPGEWAIANGDNLTLRIALRLAAHTPTTKPGGCRSPTDATFLLRRRRTPTTQPGLAPGSAAYRRSCCPRNCSLFGGPEACARHCPLRRRNRPGTTDRRTAGAARPVEANGGAMTCGHAGNTPA